MIAAVVGRYEFAVAGAVPATPLTISARPATTKGYDRASTCVTMSPRQNFAAVGAHSTGQSLGAFFSRLKKLKLLRHDA